VIDIRGFLLQISELKMQEDIVKESCQRIRGSEHLGYPDSLQMSLSGWQELLSRTIYKSKINNVHNLSRNENNWITWDDAS